MLAVLHRGVSRMRCFYILSISHLRHWGLVSWTQGVKRMVHMNWLENMAVHFQGLVFGISTSKYTPFNFFFWHPKNSELYWQMEKWALEVCVTVFLKGGVCRQSPSDWCFSQVVMCRVPCLYSSILSTGTFSNEGKVLHLLHPVW